MIHIKIDFIQLTKPSQDRVRSAFFGVLGIVAIWVQTRKGIQRLHFYISHQINHTQVSRASKGHHYFNFVATWGFKLQFRLGLMNYFYQVGHEIFQNKFWNKFWKHRNYRFFLWFWKFQKGNFFLKIHTFLELKMHMSWEPIMLET